MSSPGNNQTYIISTVIIAVVISLIIIWLLRRPKSSTLTSTSTSSTDPCAGTIQSPFTCKLTKPTTPSHTWFIAWDPVVRATSYEITVDFYDTINDDGNTIETITFLPNYTLIIDSSDFSEEIKVTITIVAADKSCNKKSSEVTFNHH